MSLRLYLAMTEAEIRRAPVLPQHLAYMACHFSPYGTGLVNIPERLPPESILIVNDRVPVLSHDPVLIARQLLTAAHRLRLFGILMDLQIPNNPTTAEVVKSVTGTLPCPVAVSELYGAELSCPVFGAPPIYCSLSEYAQNKGSRPLWLEVHQEAVFLAISDSGCTIAPEEKFSGKSFTDDTLQCNYRYKIQKERALFHLSRQLENIPGYLRKAESLGIEVAIGLYQQLGNTAV